MSWPAAIVALTLAGLTCALTPAVLRALPEPMGPDTVGKPGYAALATPRFAWGVGAVSLAGGLIAFGALPAEHWLAWVALTSVNALACVIDARTTWLPARLSHAGWVIAAAGVPVVAVSHGSAWPVLGAAAGAIALGGGFHLLWRLSGAFGYGDVRLAATIGAVTGLVDADLVWVSAFAGTMVGALIGIGFRLGGRRGAFPYGPGLLAGPFVALGVRALMG
ncbi:MAG: prepilin peptidase [Propioniciclava sp.]|uniref:prepilin peptidase n=1 Tax=Propioniciclava sp. TaxID=2038686 RepID=UPI0039E27466